MDDTGKRRGTEGKEKEQNEKEKGDEKKEKKEKKHGEHIASPESFVSQKMIPPRHWFQEVPKGETYKQKEITITAIGASNIRKGRHVRATNPILQFWVWTTRDLESFGAPHLRSSTLELEDRGDCLNPRWHWQNILVEREDVMEKEGVPHYQSVYFFKLVDRHVVRGDRFLGEVILTSEEIHSGKIPLGEQITRPLQPESWVLKDNKAHRPPEKRSKKRENKKVRGELLFQVLVKDMTNAAPLAFLG